MDQTPPTLDRFVEAQRSAYDSALAELIAGCKQGHWIWFVFPQLRGLGLSTTSEFFGLESLEEARAYLVHPVLGPRLVQCTEAVCAHSGKSLRSMLGYPDDLKFLSCMTLFSIASGGALPFSAALELFAQGKPDARTVALLGETLAG
jgi:uncharacterized protein (DUF1810 family)